MGNRHHGAFEVVQEAFQPGDGLGVEVVGRFVEQQHIRFFQQQTAQRDAAAFTTGKISDFRIPVRQAQGVGRALQLDVQVVAVVRWIISSNLPCCAASLSKSASGSAYLA